jgi:hypothetical protein
MIGYFEPRSVKGIHDDIFVSAVSFDDGKEKALVVSIELLQLSSEKCDYFRNEMARSAGIKKEAIFLNFSHTHTAPTVGGRAHLDVEANPEYDKIFEEALCRAAREAFSDMRESELSYAEGEVSGVAFVRRFRMKDGSVRTSPGVDNPDIDYPLGAPDEGLKIVRIDRDGGENLVFVSFGLHADTVGGEYVSADWPGVVRDVVEKTIDNARLIFLLGAQGDVNHINVHPTEGERRGLDYATFDGVPRGYAHAEHIGRKIGGIAIGLYGKAEPVRADAVSFASKRIYIPSNRDNSKLDMAKKIKSLFDSGRTHELPYKDMELTTVVAEALRICQLENGPDGFEFTRFATRGQGNKRAGKMLSWTVHLEKPTLDIAGKPEPTEATISYQVRAQELQNDVRALIVPATAIYQIGEAGQPKLTATALTTVRCQNVMGLSVDEWLLLGWAGVILVGSVTFLFFLIRCDRAKGD